MSDTLKAPHLKFIADEKIDMDSAQISASLKNKIKKWDAHHAKYNANGSAPDLKSRLKTELEASSPEILAELKDELKDDDEAAKKAAAKKTDDEAKKKAEEEAAAKKKAEEEAAAKNKSTKANPYGLTDDQIEQKKIIDKLYSEKAVKGVVEISETELEGLGFNCWAHLGMVGGKLGPYVFSSNFMSSTWKIEKSKDNPA